MASPLVFSAMNPCAATLLNDTVAATHSDIPCGAARPRFTNLADLAQLPILQAWSLTKRSFINSSPIVENVLRGIVDSWLSLPSRKTNQQSKKCQRTPSPKMSAVEGYDSLPQL
jgi:hypothetical protein